MDWAAHLEHLQTILCEFDADAVISKPVLIRLFRNGLRPSICAQAKQEGCQKNTWDQAIKKTITAEAKAALNLPLWVCEMDACSPWGKRSALKPTKDYTRDWSSLPFRPHKAQAMLPYCFKQNVTKRPRRDHQKGRCNKNRRNSGLCGSRPQGSTPATLVDTTKTPAQNDRDCNRPVQREDKNLSRTNCYHYNKKGHFAYQCPELGKPKI